jgi:hypothetical protein
VEAEALRSSLLQSRSLPKTLWFWLQKRWDDRSALRRNADQLVKTAYLLTQGLLYQTQS